MNSGYIRLTESVLYVVVFRRLVSAKSRPNITFIYSKCFHCRTMWHLSEIISEHQGNSQSLTLTGSPKEKFTYLYWLSTRVFFSQKIWSVVIYIVGYWLQLSLTFYCRVFLIAAEKRSLHYGCHLTQTANFTRGLGCWLSPVTTTQGHIHIVCSKLKDINQNILFL